MGIAQWTTYSGTNSLVRYADSMGMEWNDLELQCMAIDATLHNQNPYSGWYDTGMGKYYGVTKADFWEGDLKKTRKRQLPFLKQKPFRKN